MSSALIQLARPGIDFVRLETGHYVHIQKRGVSTGQQPRTLCGVYVTWGLEPMAEQEVAEDRLCKLCARGARIREWVVRSTQQEEGVA